MTERVNDMKKCRIIIAIISVIAMMLVFASCGEKAEIKVEEKAPVTEAETFPAADGFSYRILEDDSAEIISYESAERVQVLEIPEELDGHAVAVIGENAFEGFENAYAVYLPKSLTEVKKAAFKGSSISKIYMFRAHSLKTIGDEAFAGCGELIQVIFSEGIESIGNKAFSGCSKLFVAQFRSDIKKIASDAFESCPKIKAYLPEEYPALGAFCKDNSIEMIITKAD